MELKQLASNIIEYVGGEKNIKALEHCSTRLRFTIKDNKKVDEKKLEQLDGVMGVIKGSAQLQVIIGTKVHDVCEEIYAQTNIQAGTGTDGDDKKQGNIFMRVLAVIPQVFTPILPVIMAGGLLKAVFAILLPLNILNATSSTYQILNFASDVGFYFLPIFVAMSAAKVFKTNMYMAALIGAVLLHPSWSAIVGAKEAITLFGLPVALVSYSSTMLPSIIGVWVLAYVDRFFNKYIPEFLKYVFVPLCTFIVMLFLMFVIIGPIGFYCGTYVAEALMGIYDVAGWLAIVLIAAFKPLLVMTGMHYALTTAFLTMFTATGVDKFYLSASILANLGQSGATFGVFLKSKNTKTKSIALSTAFTAFMGITEPAMFGITLKYKRPFIGAMIGAAAGALYAALMGVQFVAMTGVGITGVLGALPQYLVHILIACGITMVVSAVVTYMLGFDEEIEQVETKTEKKPQVAHRKEDANTFISAPLTGDVVDLALVPDPAFSSEAIGKGIAIMPSEGKVYAPVDGEVTTLFQSSHAIGITAVSGEEILIHVGLDTVQLKGEYFHAYVKQGDRIHKGDLVLEFDIPAIQAKGYNVITPVVVTNKNDYMDIFCIHEQEKVHVNDDLLAVIAK